MLLLEFGIYQSALQARLATGCVVTAYYSPPTAYCPLRITCHSVRATILLLTRQGCFLVHLLLSWYFRDRYYRLYLRTKHWVKNRTVWRRASYGDVESEPLAKKKKRSSSRAS